MMNRIPSVCTNLWFPESRKSLAEFERVAAFLSEKGVRAMEYYHDGDSAHKTGAVLSTYGLSSVHIAVIPLKEQLLNLCGTDADNRLRAVALAKNQLDLADSNGAASLMLCSGKIEPGRDEAAMDALVASIEELHNYKIQKGYALSIELEPCDSHMDAKHFVGPYQRTLALCQALEARGVELRLTMDSAHTAEEGQDFLEAVKAVRPYCAHIHYANCEISDPGSPLYGDKHLGYEYPNTPFTYENLHALTRELDALYPGDTPLMIGMECLCREPDPYEYFSKAWTQLWQ